MKTAIGIVIIALVAAITAFQLRFQKPGANADGTLPVIRAVPDFTLTERSGANVSLADLKGKVWLAEIFYSTCPGPCPMISTNVAALQQEALAVSPDTRLVSFTIDPAHDTPERLRDYAGHYDASPDRWLFLTGDPAKMIELVTKGFMVAVVKEEGKAIVHGTQLLLIDRQGRIRAIYNGVSGEEHARIIEDMRRLAAE